MEKIVIQAEKRIETGKGAARSLRRSEMIPAVIYRAGGSVPIKLPKKPLTQLLNTTAGQQIMISLQFADGENKLALLKEFQVDPTRKELLHVDFFEVSLTEEVKVSLHVVPFGEPIGVKRDAGLLQHVLREVEIECLPDKIPGSVKIDISRLEIGQSLHVRDLQLGEGVKILTDPAEVIVNIIPPAVEAAPAAEGAAPEAVPEPEVVKKGKKEEEAAG